LILHGAKYSKAVVCRGSEGIRPGVTFSLYGFFPEGVYGFTQLDISPGCISAGESQKEKPQETWKNKKIAVK